MKNHISKIIPAIILSFALNFMLFIYEPITVFISNSEDYWFGFNKLLKSNLLISILFFLIIVVISILIYFLSTFIKKKKIYTIYLVLLSSCFVYLYIQGNYFSGKLPILDGTPIEWNNYTMQSITSYLLIILVVIVNIIILKTKKENYYMITSFISASICVMLVVGLIPSLTKLNEVPTNKGVYISTNKDINILSNNTNFLILLIDMLDSKTFDEVIKKNNKESLLSDFTYFPDTLSAYPFTRESIPYILSGEWYEADIPYNEYYKNACNNSKFIEELKKREYEVNIYEQDLQWNDKKSLEINNIKNINYDINIVQFFKQEAKYTIFKYFPYSLKKYSHIETLDYMKCRKGEMKYESAFNPDNKVVYDTLDKIKVKNKNYFQFLHIDGGHYPWNMNKDFELIENGTYEEKIESSITVIDKYLDRIKESNQYDNSIIIILADHGNNGYDPVGRQNPSLYIKGLNEKHDEMQISNKKASYVDLNDSIYYDLLKGKKSTELLSEIDDNRVRRFIWYKDYDKMFEQTLDGHAWETDKLKNTGKKYER